MERITPFIVVLVKMCGALLQLTVYAFALCAEARI